MANTPVSLIAAALSAAAGDKLKLCCPGDSQYEPGMNKLELNQLHKLTLAWIHVPTDPEPTVLLVGGFRLIVKSLTGKTLTIQVLPSYTIKRVKELIKNLEGTPIEEQKLIFSGLHLEDDRTLSYYNCVNESTFYVVLLLRGGGRCIHELNSDILDPIYDYDFTDIPADEKSLTFSRGGSTYVRPGNASPSRCEENTTTTDGWALSPGSAPDPVTGSGRCRTTAAADRSSGTSPRTASI